MTIYQMMQTKFWSIWSADNECRLIFAINKILPLPWKYQNPLAMPNTSRKEKIRAINCDVQMKLLAINSQIIAKASTELANNSLRRDKTRA